MSPGRALFSFYLSGGFSMLINLSDYGVSLAPGDQLLFSCQSFGDTDPVYLSISWIEQF